MPRNIINTDRAPAAIGPYSQAVQHGDIVFLSGQTPLVPETMELIKGDIAAQAHQVFRNLRAVCKAAGSNLDGIIKLNIYMIDLGNFATVNGVMAEYFSEPYPARATVGVSALPMGAEVEMEAILGL